MKRLLKQKRMLAIIFLTIFVTSVEGYFGAQFFHGEMSRQIDETLKTQALQIVQGYEIQDQSKKALLAGIQSDAMELNRIHGEFILNVLNEAYRETLNGTLNESLVRNRVIGILNHSENSVGENAYYIEKASEKRNELDHHFRSVFEKSGYAIEYIAKKPADLYNSGTLDIVVKGKTETAMNGYAKAVYHAPLDVIVLFGGNSDYEGDTVDRLFKSIQKINERTIAMAGSMEDVIIIQENGYTLYSGHFEKGNPHRVTRLVYNAFKDTQAFPATITGVSDTFRTLKINNPDGQLEERYAYIHFDQKHHNYVLVSRPTADIRNQEAPLVAIGRFVAFVNIIVFCFIAYMLVSRDEALAEEGVNP